MDKRVLFVVHRVALCALLKEVLHDRLVAGYDRQVEWGITLRVLLVDQVGAA